MKGGKKPQGYTIIEVLIVLAASGVLFGLAVLAVSGQSARAEYTQAIKNIETKITDIANDVRTGYFPNAGGDSCTVSSGKPTFYPGPNEQGSNRDCIFIGKLLQFRPLSKPTSINVFTLAGRRVNSGGNNVSSIIEANPVLVNTSGIPPEEYNLQYNMEVKSVKLNGGDFTGVLAFATSFNAIVAGNSEGTPITHLYRLTVPSGSQLNKEKSDFANFINNFPPAPEYQRLGDGDRIQICLLKDNKTSELVMGARGNKLSVETEVGKAC